VRYRDALAVPEFRALFAAYSISILGSVVSAVALTVLVYERTGSPFLSSLTFALGFLPYVVSGLLLSAVVDRQPPRRLLTASDLTCALLVALMAWPRTPIPALLGLLTLVSTVTSISSGARGGLVRAVVGDAVFVPARSLLRICSQSAQIAGNGVGGMLLVALSPRSLILVNAVSFAVSALVTRLGLRHRPAETVDARGPLLLDSLRGAGAILKDRTLRRLLLFGWLLPPFSVAPEALAAPYVLGSGSSRALVGWWLVALPVGVICGDLVGVWLLTASQQRRLIVPIAALGFAPYLVFLARPPIPLALPLLVVSGLGAAYFLGLDGIIRDTAPRPLFVRTMAINTAGLMTIQGVGFAAAGGLAQVLSPAVVIAVAGACGLLTILVLRPVARPATGGARTAPGAASPDRDAIGPDRQISARRHQQPFGRQP
jgi:MFS family permease